MKKLLVRLGGLALMLLLALPVYAQDIGGSNVLLANRAQLFKTYTNYTATSDDTTGFISLTTDPVLKSDVLLASYVAIIGVSTDSLSADLNFNGTNGTLTGVTATYADSAITTNNAGANFVIVLRAPGVNRLVGTTQLKLGTVFRASGQGTTTGRTLKWYILWRR